MITEINIVNKDFLLHTSLWGRILTFAIQPHTLQGSHLIFSLKHFCLPLSLACGTNMVKNIPA